MMQKIKIGVNTGQCSSSHDSILPYIPKINSATNKRDLLLHVEKLTTYFLFINQYATNKISKCESYIAYPK